MLRSVETQPLTGGFVLMVGRTPPEKREEDKGEFVLWEKGKKRKEGEVRKSCIRVGLFLISGFSKSGLAARPGKGGARGSAGVSALAAAAAAGLRPAAAAAASALTPPHPPRPPRLFTLFFMSSDVI